MHEFSIGQELVKAIIEEMGRLIPPPHTLRSAHVVVGALRQIMPEQLTFAYEVLTHDTPADGSTLRITTLPVTVCCRQCGEQNELEEPLFLCSACESPDVEMIHGMELYLDQLEVDYDDADGD